MQTDAVALYPPSTGRIRRAVHGVEGGGRYQPRCEALCMPLPLHFCQCISVWTGRTSCLMIGRGNAPETRCLAAIEETAGAGVR